jgi:hypothetical protein
VLSKPYTISALLSLLEKSLRGNTG